MPRRSGFAPDISAFVPNRRLAPRDSRRMPPRTLRCVAYRCFKVMRMKSLLLATIAVLAAGGWWFARSTGHPEAPPAERGDARVDTPPDSIPGRPVLRPPDPSRRFMDFTPEQRVEFARKGHGPGG